MNNSKEYQKEWHRIHPEAAKKYYKKWRLNHLEKEKERCRIKWKIHKTWMIKNCQMCGKFCPKESKKYCKDCRHLMNYLMTLARNLEYHYIHYKSHPKYCCICKIVKINNNAIICSSCRKELKKI